jgi:outer membrane receptor protein involved in Fe transport
VYDFNVNARGFNSSLNRRVLVLQDGRDLSIAFLGSQEWSALSIPTEDFSKVEFVSGPGSALYGANAYNGVLDLTTPTAREAIGTRATVGGGSLETIRADLRQGGVAGGGRFGYRLNVGFASSDTWSRSRTNIGDLASEYAEVTDSAVNTPSPGFELLPLAGQTKSGTPGPATGDRDPIRNIYGSGRFDYYMENGNILTAEGGAAHTENEVFVTGIGRVQVTGALRPWARVALASTGYNFMAHWNARRTLDPQFSLASGAGLEEHSDIFHVEGQGNHGFAEGRGRVVYGGSLRNIRINTDSTLMRGQDDDRSDYYYAGFAQFSWDVSPVTRLVLAGRFDVGSLIDPQFSPKAALVISPNERHSVRVTVNQAFQTPNYSEFYLRVAAGRPVDFTALESALRLSALGPALAGVPVGELFTTTAAVPVFARGNANLDVEKTTGFEIGYRGDVTRRVAIELDGFYNLLSNFVTDLLPGVNKQQFPSWTAPTAVPSAARGPLVRVVDSVLRANPATRTAALGLTRLEDGRTAIVVSYASAGQAQMWGANLGATFQITDEFQADGFVSWFDFDVDEDELQTGDKLLPNTPEWRTRLAIGYTGRQGFDARLGFRTSSGFPWAAGVLFGYIEPNVQFDASAGYRVNNNFRVFATGTNIFDNKWFSLYGGSVNGVRVLGGVTATF